MKRPKEKLAYAALRDVPGTRVQVWAVEVCPLCGKSHYHSAGPWQGDPRAKLGEVAAPCEPARQYLLVQAPSPRKGSAKNQRRAERRKNKRGGWDDE